MAKYETNSVFAIRSHQSAECNVYNVFTGYKERTIDWAFSRKYSVLKSDKY